MGKINQYKDIEVIPIASGATGHSKNIVNPFKMNRNVYLNDPIIISRVQKYLESNINNQFIDINVMADELQRKYAKDYGRRKRSAFRSLVKKAYAVLMQTYGVLNRNNSESDFSEESVGDDQISVGENIPNNQLLEMYVRNMDRNAEQRKPMDDNELIDISSDDSNESPSKSANGPSTSKKHSVEPNPLQSLLQRQPPLSEITVVKESSSTAMANAPDRGKKRKTENNSYSSVINSIAKKKRGIINPCLEEPKVTMDDIGGMDKVLTNLCDVLYFMKHPEVHKTLGTLSSRGLLLHGPPGCGKSLLAHAIAGELEIPLLKVAATELVAGISGGSEERIRELFERAMLCSPCVLFIDEIDVIASSRQFSSKDMERRIVSQLISCLDDLRGNELGDRVLVCGATNRLDCLDTALRRAGRFDTEVAVGIPDTAAREQILKILTTKVRLEENFNFEKLSKLTPGYVGADLLELVSFAAKMATARFLKDMMKCAGSFKPGTLVSKAAEASESDQPSKNGAEIVVDGDENSKSENQPDAAVVIIDDEKPAEKVDPKPSIECTEIEEPEAVLLSALNLSPLQESRSILKSNLPLCKENLKNLYITSADFAIALKSVQPSAKREGFATVPNVTWEDVGSLKAVRKELQMAILAPIRYPKQFQSMGITTPTGILLCGPPGCGKTLIAKAIANEAEINFISVKGPELLNMYVGESERAVRVCFERARNSAPCVIFFDEIDALCSKRSESKEGATRVVNQMLTEMDGVESRNGVYLLAASNRPDMIDSAVLRPGRLDKILYVGLPSPDERVDILKTITKNGTSPQFSPEVDLEVIGKSEACDGYTGADLTALIREATNEALSESMELGNMDKPLAVTTAHLTKTVTKLRPSISEKDKQHYEKLRKLYSAKQPEVEEMELS